MPANLDAAVVRAAHEITDEGYRFPYGDVINLDQNLGYRNTPYVVNQLAGAFIEIPDFLDSRHTVETQADAAAYADRVVAYALALDGETARLSHDRGLGVIAPDFTLANSEPMIGAGAKQRPGDTTLVKSIARSAAKAKLGDAPVERVRRIVASQVLPALRRQHAELVHHRARADARAGVWKLPDGDAYYRWTLKAGTTTDRSPDDIHQLGLDQVRSIQARMDGIMLVVDTTT